MQPLEWFTLALGPIAAITTQAVKQAIPKPYHRYIPLALLPLCAVLGAVGFYYWGGDPARGGVLGFLSGASAVGLYEFSKNSVGILRSR